MSKIWYICKIYKKTITPVNVFLKESDALKFTNTYIRKNHITWKKRSSHMWYNSDHVFLLHREKLEIIPITNIDTYIQKIKRYEFYNRD